MNAIGAVGVPKALLEAEDHAMRLAAVQMSRIARGLPAESKVRRQMMQNARWWRLSAVHPSTTGQQRGELEFPRFRGHLIAGPSGPAARIDVHAVNPAVFA